MYSCSWLEIKVYLQLQRGFDVASDAVHNTVGDRWDALDTLAATCFGNLYFPNGLWAASAKENIRLQGLPMRVKVVTKFICLHSINSSGAPLS